MEATCLAIAHAELGGIAAQRAAHCRPHLVENRTMTSNVMTDPLADRAHLACQEENGACATTALCGVQHGKDVMGVKRVQIGARWGARIDILGGAGCGATTRLTIFNGGAPRGATSEGRLLVLRPCLAGGV